MKCSHCSNLTSISSLPAEITSDATMEVTEFRCPQCGAAVYSSDTSVTSFCKNPTFDGIALTLETHILDFSGDLYGREVEVRFLKELRGERRFESPVALRSQLLLDMDARRAMPL